MGEQRDTGYILCTRQRAEAAVREGRGDKHNTND